MAEVALQETDPDVQRMLAFKAGDDSAFDGLFERWAGPLLRYLERMVGDAGTAEDLVQEAFFRVHRARERYVATARFSTFLYRIATNLALNELSRPRRRHDHGSDLSAVRSGGPPPDAEVDARRAHAVVERELEKLPERQRAALWLSAAEGHSYAEIAEIIDTSESSVKALVHRGRVALVDRMHVLRAGRRANASPRSDALQTRDSAAADETEPGAATRVHVRPRRRSF